LRNVTNMIHLHPHWCPCSLSKRYCSIKRNICTLWPCQSVGWYKYDFIWCNQTQCLTKHSIHYWLQLALSELKLGSLQVLPAIADNWA